MGSLSIVRIEHFCQRGFHVARSGQAARRLTDDRLGSVRQSDRSVIHFSVMDRSITTSVREQLAVIPVGTFVWSRDLEGPSAPVETALARIAREPESPVIRVRKGLYWRTVWTRFGPTGPQPSQIAQEIAGLGGGPAGATAVHDLGLTTQVPGVEFYAVAGRAPRPIRGVRFVSRQYHRRELGLGPLEVAVIEVLKAESALVEAEWSDVVERIRSLVTAGQVRLGVLRLAVEKEHDLGVRRKFAMIEREFEHAAA
jgi:hypothetical protein